jgi:hypothetical protein
MVFLEPDRSGIAGAREQNQLLPNRVGLTHGPARASPSDGKQRQLERNKHSQRSFRLFIFLILFKQQLVEYTSGSRKKKHFFYLRT